MLPGGMIQMVKPNLNLLFSFLSYKIYIAIPVICLLVIFFIVFFSFFTHSIDNLLKYGQWKNPCVNVDLYKKADRMDMIFYNEKFDCYSTKQSD